MMLKIKYILLVIILTLPLASYATKADIVAKVGDDVISSASLDKRIELMIKSAGMQDTLETRREIADKALQNLINEKLQEQYAAKFNVAVSDSEVNAAFSELAKINNTSPEKFARTILDQDISLSATVENLRSQVLWQKLLASKIRPLVKVTDEEVERKFDDVSKQLTDKQIEVFEILITVSEDYNKTKLIVDELYSKASTTSKFITIAKQFSESPTGVNGGKLGYISMDKLSNEVRNIYRNNGLNKTAKPVYDKNLDAFRIIRIGEERNAAQDLTKDKVRETLLLKKMKREGERFMNELYNSTYVEVRG